MIPKPGDLLLIGRRASVQFAGDRAIVLRVVSVSARPTYHGWCWLTGYIVDLGRAVERREVFVQLAGLRFLPPAPRLAGGPVPTVRAERRRGV